MSNLAGANVRGLIIYITESGGLAVTADRLSLPSPEFHTGRWSLPWDPQGDMGGSEEPQRTVPRSRWGDAFPGVPGPGLPASGSWVWGAADVRAESVAPAPTPTHVPFPGAGMEEA